MYRHFDYGLSLSQRDLQAFYEKPGLEQHAVVQRCKSRIKIERVHRSAPFSVSDRVLDYGCGAGDALHALAGRIREGIGVDIALPRAPAPEGTENIRFEAIGIDGPLPFAATSFDKVLMLDVLEHVLAPEAVVAECRRVVRREGTLVVEVPFTGLLSEAAAGAFHQGHLRYYDPEYLADWLYGCGLDVLSVRTFNSVPLSGWWLRIPAAHRCIDRLCGLVPSRLYPWFGEILAVCRPR